MRVHPNSLKNLIHGFKKGMIPWNKGKVWSVENRLKLSNGQKKRFQNENVWNKGVQGYLAGTKHYAWKGGILDGKRRPAGSVNGVWKRKSRLIVESVIGRQLLSREVVHHINENPSDNRKENLFLFRHSAAHQRWHLFLKRHGLKKMIGSNLSLCE